jgi:glycosyltransferase involved in cell wall biosynthesis
MPTVSVIISSYNHEKYVGECIQSILDQTYQDFEIVITDDGSTDRTVEIMESFDDPRIRLFKPPSKMGAPMSFNNCIRHSSGKYIASIGSDDAWLPEKLEVQVKYLDEHPDIAVVFSKVTWVNELGDIIPDENNPYKGIFEVQNRTRFKWLNYFFKQGNCLNMPSSLIRRDCFAEIGLFNPVLAGLHDFDLWVRICFKHEIMILDEKLVRYRWMSDNSNASSHTKNKQIRHRFENKQILNHYLKITEPAELLAIFPDAIQYGRMTTDTIPYFLGRIAIDSNVDYKVLWGEETIFALLQNEKAAQALEENCNFKYWDFINIVPRNDVFSSAMDEIINSRGWKTVLLFRQIFALIIPPASLRARLLQGIFRFTLSPLLIKVRQNRNIKKDLVLITTSDLFDETWYMSNTPNLAQAGIDPARHYLLVGGFQGCDPGPNFSSVGYLNAYEDVKKSGVNPLVHYLRSGREEGRAAKPEQIEDDGNVFSKEQYE